MPEIFHKGLSASLEDYLETVLAVISEKKAVRAKDIAQRLGVSRASVTSALQALGERKYINYAPYDVITLTEEGKALASEIWSKHHLLTSFFKDLLGAEPVLAEEVACKLEHFVPNQILERMNLFNEFIVQQSGGLDLLQKRFEQFCIEKQKDISGI